MKYTYLSIFALALSSGLSAQTAPMWSNQGSLVAIRDSATFISIHGNARNDNGGLCFNEGTIHLTGDWDNFANNQAFSSLNEGIVRLWGDDQNIGGTEITRFYDLRLEETGVKSAAVDVHVGGHLRLNDREFRLGPNRAEVFNPDPLNAVETGLNGFWGFVSAEDNGGLIRHIDRAATYFYPLGSVAGNSRFRPINLYVSSTGAHRLRARHANLDASADSYDRNLRQRSICEVNPLYYHHLQDPDNSGLQAQIEVLYEPSADGSFNAWGQWLGGLWREAAQGLAGTNTTYNLASLRSDVTLSDFQNFPFALITTAPELTLNHNGPELCTSQPLELSTQGGFYNLFDFFVDSNLDQSGPDSSYTRNPLNLAPGTYPVWVEADNGLCGRRSDTLLLTVYQAPSTFIAPDTIIRTGGVANLYGGGGEFYQWSPNQNLACDFCPQTEARPEETTTYSLRIETLEGCVVIDTMRVTVQPDANSVLFIPNVLTPNGDGKNDTWFIRGLELFAQHSITILNRWGDVIFRTENYRNDWEGNYNGGRLPAGTYYYILDLGQVWGLFKGPVTIIRE